MARARSATGLISDHSADLRQIEAWYRHRLASTPPPQYPEGLAPVRIGPTWQHDADGWILPEHTLGWQALAWAGLWLRGPDGGPWTCTMEQARWLLHLLAVDLDAGTVRPLWTRAVLQRLKGWGKDPLAVVLAYAYLLGPVRPVIDGDRLVGEPDPEATVQVAATSAEQTQTTIQLLPATITPEARDWYGVQVLTTGATAMGGTRHLMAVSSNPLSLEGWRPSLVIRNETQNWRRNNAGHDMAGVIDGNAAKAPAHRPTRVVDLCNAYIAGHDSIAQRVREGWEESQGPTPKRRATRLLYDSLEAPATARLTADDAPRVVEVVRGDSTWLDVERIRDSILDPLNPPSESRRKWYNQVASEEDAWLVARDWDSCRGDDVSLVEGDELVVFLDCGKSDDATALVGCRLSDGAVITLGMWQRPPSARAHGWVAPREAVDAAVREVLDRHRVVGLWIDPSHARDDETMAGYWDGVVDGLHRDYSGTLRMWAQGSSRRAEGSHSTAWDMSDPKNLRRFVAQVSRTASDITSGELIHDGDPRLRHHALNARRVPSRYGPTISKNHRESQRKIDLAVAMVGARLMRREWLNSGRKRKGKGLW